MSSSTPHQTPLFTRGSIIFFFLSLVLTYVAVNWLDGKEVWASIRSKVYSYTLMRFRPVQPKKLLLVPIGDHERWPGFKCNDKDCRLGDYLSLLIQEIVLYKPKSIALDMDLVQNSSDATESFDRLIASIVTTAHATGVNFVFVERLGRVNGDSRFYLHGSSFYRIFADNENQDIKGQIFFGYDQLSDDILRVPWTVEVAKSSDSNETIIRDSFAVAFAKSIDATLPIWLEHEQPTPFPYSSFWRLEDFNSIPARVLFSREEAGRRINSMFPSKSLRDVGVLIGTQWHSQRANEGELIDLVRGTPLGDIPGMYIQACYTSSIFSVFTLFNEVSSRVAHAFEWAFVAMIFLFQRLSCRKLSMHTAPGFLTIAVQIVFAAFIYLLAVVGAIFGRYLDYPIIIVALIIHTAVGDYFESHTPVWLLQARNTIHALKRFLH